MAKPRFTDKFRWRTAYVPANQTNLAETFRRVREEIERNAAEVKTKVEPISRRRA